MPTCMPTCVRIQPRLLTTPYVQQEAGRGQGRRHWPCRRQTRLQQRLDSTAVLPPHTRHPHTCARRGWGGYHERLAAGLRVGDGSTSRAGARQSHAAHTAPSKHLMGARVCGCAPHALMCVRTHACSTIATHAHRCAYQMKACHTGCNTHNYNAEHTCSACVHRHRRPSRAALSKTCGSPCAAQRRHGGSG